MVSVSPTNSSQKFSNSDLAPKYLQKESHLWQEFASFEQKHMSIIPCSEKHVIVPKLLTYLVARYLSSHSSVLVHLQYLLDLVIWILCCILWQIMSNSLIWYILSRKHRIDSGQDIKRKQFLGIVCSSSCSKVTSSRLKIKARTLTVINRYTNSHK